MSDNVIQTGVRLDKALLKRIDDHTQEMAKIMPGFSRNMMLNLLLNKGIEVYEQEQRQAEPEPELAGKRG
jgi:hypothetical protein